MQHAKQQHAGKGGHRHHAVAPPVEIRLEAARVEAVSNRADHDGCEHRLRRVRDPGEQGAHRGEYHGAGNQPGAAALRAGRFVGRRAGEARAHRHAVEQARGEVGQS